MKRWGIGVLIFLAIGLIGFAYLYQFAGLRQYFRAVEVIKTTTPEEERIKVIEDFYGTDPRGAERGILAGSGLGRVWIWSGRGLKSYKVDENSIYSWFDGCREDVRARLNKGEANVIQGIIDTNMQNWSEKVQVGDYVAVYPTLSGAGGVEGNLREIYAYNFWLFMRRGIDRQCAK